MHNNPYESPAYVPVEAAVLAKPESKTRPVRAFGRWTLICAISAAPSFFWGCALNHRAEHVAAMICGILVFVSAYTALECTRYYHQVIVLPHVYRTALIGYGTRLLISVVFPIGLFIDMMTGVVSVGLVEGMLGTSASTAGGERHAMSFAGVFLTTLVQGALLNAMLFGYMLGIYGLSWTISSIRQRLRARARLTSPVASS